MTAYLMALLAIIHALDEFEHLSSLGCLQTADLLHSVQLIEGDSSLVVSRISGQSVALLRSSNKPRLECSEQVTSNPLALHAGFHRDAQERGLDLLKLASTTPTT